MPQPGLVVSNYALQKATDLFRELLNSNTAYLRLFGNDFVPTPGTLLPAFTESNYTGYHAINLGGKFPPLQKVIDGEYQSTGPIFVWQCMVGAGQLVYGCYISDGANLLASINFANPVLMQAGVSFQLQISPQGWALVIVP